MLLIYLKLKFVIAIHLFNRMAGAAYPNYMKPYS